MTPDLVRRLRGALSDAFRDRAETWSEAEAWALATELERRGLWLSRGVAIVADEAAQQYDVDAVAKIDGKPDASAFLAAGPFELVGGYW